MVELNKPKTILIAGVIFSIVLIVGIVIFFLTKNTTPNNTAQKVTKNTTPNNTAQKEVYLQSFNMWLDYPYNFKEVKRLIFPTNPNITLATLQQVKDAMTKGGLKVCAGALGLDNNGMEEIILARPGPPDIQGLASLCTKDLDVRVSPVRSDGIKEIWVYGVKPKKATVEAKGISPFSPSKWSQFDP